METLEELLSKINEIQIKIDDVERRILELNNNDPGPGNNGKLFFDSYVYFNFSVKLKRETPKC